MRALLLLVGLLGSLLPAQTKMVRMDLGDGVVVEGRVVHLDTKTIVVDVDGEQRTYETSKAKDFHFTEVIEPASGTPPKPADGEAAAPTAARPAQDPGRPAARVTDSTPRPSPRGRALWDTRVQALDRAFPWLFPAEPLQWISLGITLFALLSLAIHFAARVSATDRLGFGRALGFGFIALAGTVAQMAVLPSTDAALGGAAAVNVIVSIILFKGLYALSFPGSMLAVFVLSIEGGIGYALLKLVDATLRSIGNTTF